MPEYRMEYDGSPLSKEEKELVYVYDGQIKRSGVAKVDGVEGITLVEMLLFKYPSCT